MDGVTEAESGVPASAMSCFRCCVRGERGLHVAVRIVLGDDFVDVPF